MRGNYIYDLPINFIHMSTKPLAPRRLGRDIHNISSLTQEPKPSLSPTNNPQNIYKVTLQQRPVRRLDRQVLQQRKQLIQHPTIISSDTPDWWKSTFKYYHRDSMPTPKKVKPLEKYDIFNLKKGSYHTIQQARKMVKKPQEFIASKIGGQDHIIRNKSVDVTPKIGTMEHRDYSVKKPLLKIGKASFIDTYQV